jgi:putative transposase
VIEWLQTKDEWTFNELEYQVASKYGVTFSSKQSYYDLFHEARINWKKTQAHNQGKRILNFNESAVK